MIKFTILSFKNKKINTLSSKSIQTEKAKFSHFDRTRGDKNQIFRTLDYHHAEWAQIKESEEVQILTLIPSDQKVPESLIDFKSQTVILQLKDS